MTILRCWAPNIRGRSPKMARRSAPFLLMAVAVLPLSGQDGLAQLKQGVSALEDGRPAAAVAPLKAAQAKLPRIADYPAFFLAQAYTQLKSFADVPAMVETVIAMRPESPMAGYAAVLGARSLLEMNDFKGAAALLARVDPARLPQPDGLLLTAKAREGAGNLLAATAAWQALYHEYPLSQEAGEAAPALERMRSTLGGDYPEPKGAVRLARADRILAARQYAKARAEFETLASELKGLDADLARVRIGAADFQGRKATAAASYLRSLTVASPEAGAERLWWLAAAYRRDENDAGMEEALEQLARLAPQSKWRKDALVLAGNRYLVQNRPAEFVRHFDACGAAFPGETDGAYCHWKVVWRAWLDRADNVKPLLEQHVLKFPSSEKAGASLFYLAKLAGQRGDLAAAKRLYAETATHFPNYYYAVLAREELAQPKLRTAGISEAAEKFIQSIPFPERERAPSFTPDAATTARIERARLLESAGLERNAETELRYGARNGANPWALALRMAETASRRGAHAQAVRYIKGTVPGYLFLPRDAAPERFWRLAFPFPYRARVEQLCRQHGLDPFLVASLIRQESEFDPQAVSYAGAVGLMQVMPSTGREVARRLRLGRSSVARLKNPDFNLRLGTDYLKRLLNARNGSVEETLAGYNAGGSRVKLWETWGPYREPNEFVETIPFTQTRDYVQIILRNRDIYRWLYSGTPAPRIEPEPPAAAPPPAVKRPAAQKPPAKKTAVRKRPAKKQ